MNKITSILCFIFMLPGYCLGQETIKLSVKNGKNHSSEEYYVLKSDTSIKQGLYQQFNYKHKPIIIGFYKNDQKDSLWKEFAWTGGLRKTGAYSLGQKTGIWEYYSSDGGLEQKYDHSSNTLVFDKNLDVKNNKEFKVINGSDTISAKLDQPPIYIGGKVTMVEFYKLRYPIEAMEKEISGTVLISYVLDSSGKSSAHKVFKGIGYGCDEEALNTVKGIPDNWIPAKLNGQNVTVLVLHPIDFIIEVGR